MAYEYEGNPALGQMIAAEACKLGVRAQAHNIPSLKLEYGTLVPMRYMNSDKHFKVISISAFCTVHALMTAVTWVRPSSTPLNTMMASLQF